MADVGAVDSADCPECSGPPPMFRLPPPPRPPFLTEGTFCSEALPAEVEDCSTIPLTEVSYHNNSSLQYTSLIITCAIVLLLTTTIVFVVFWKFLARTCLNAFGFSRLWQCLLTCCHLSVKGPAASLIHAPLKEPDESSRRDFTNHHPHLRHYRRYAVHQQTDASARAIHMYPPVSPEYEQVHHDQAPISNSTPNAEEAITRNKSPSGRRSTQGGTEHVIMLLSVAAQITHKKPRFL
ncbi:hypothetical protein PV327_001030 [Microctonus hyperodae]|uniref:Uncharacterized protein n=1 Tax=Microctonus hyperodae TaxID=165561 RepID=A0AA39L2T0_MICHY|nr:hypothetical protein PV327_001030 [Microctonus hyperodae]